MIKFNDLIQFELEKWKLTHEINDETAVRIANATAIFRAPSVTEWRRNATMISRRSPGVRIGVPEIENSWVATSITFIVFLKEKGRR